MSVVYFIRRGEAVKIGYAASLVGRLRALESANSEPLEVLAAIPGDRGMEAELHERFRALHIRGEWFRYEGELRDHIAGLEGIETVTKKRGYSREFTPRTDRRVRIEVDRIPPTLYDAVLAKAKREGVSLRALILKLLTDWTKER